MDSNIAYDIKNLWLGHSAFMDMQVNIYKWQG